MPDRIDPEERLARRARRRQVSLVELFGELACKVHGWIVSFNCLISMSCGLDEIVVGLDDRGDCDDAVCALEYCEGSSGRELPWLGYWHGLECCANGRWT
jgi:hypothetical protein